MFRESITAVLPFIFAPVLSRAESVEFARDILPILSDKCFKCHGPDEQSRKAKLRLDTKEGLYRTKDGITVVAPGNLEESDLIVRIMSDDSDEVMPSPKSNLTLTAEQKALFKRWVQEGGNWGRHWAFEPMRRPVVPASNHANPIDAFVAHRLAEENLTLSPPASKERWLRRVSLDLTGLPPSLAEVDAYLADQSPGADELVVDRLLASPRYGERMATDWLDLARFADTHGYQMDRYRAVWPYRDWVIKAFNENLPFDQFTTWQLAGDLLPNATKEQRLATAFNRLHSQNEEGGIVEEEFRVAYVVDRVNTFGTAFLALTFECARCHDHKYDPISQRDTYSLFAFFQNIDESGQTTYFTDSMPVPTLLLSSEEQDQELSRLKSVVREKERAIDVLREQARGAFSEWRKTTHEPTDPKPIGAFDFESLADGVLVNLANPTLPGKAEEGPLLVEDHGGHAAELSGDNGFSFPGPGHFTRSDPFSFTIAVKTSEAAPREVIFHHSKAPIDAGSRGYELLLEDGHVAFGLHHMWPGNSLKVRTQNKIPVGKWANIGVTYDGSSRAAGVRLYINGSPQPLEVVRDGLWKDITYQNDEPDLAIGYRFRDSGFKGGRVDDFQIFDRELSAIEVARVEREANQPEDDGALFDYFFATAFEPGIKARAELKASRDEQRKFIEPIMEIMTMRELPQPKPAYILNRGAYDAHGDEVTADTPHALPPFPAGAPRNRLGLAQWLLDPEHPLTARAAVNRLWQMMFGRGIVETSDNFGQQGAWPTHLDLFDWLARDFIASGWNVKALLKKIALSATYRQTSNPTPDRLERDPDGKLLSYAPAKRLTAEMLRDQALAASGLLVEKLGGPSVKPYQPPGLWEEIAMGKPTYDQSHGDDLYRRSLYTFWKRTVPPPSMVTFDAADRSYCTVRRQRTNTPLQALVLLNDIAITEAARQVATHALADTSDVAARLTKLFRTITDRSPSKRELTILNEMFIEQRTLFSKDDKNAKLLLTVGELKSNPALDPVELAATTVVAQAVFNFDESIMRR